MSHARTAVALTVGIWVVAILTATFTPRAGWIDLRWPVAIYLVAIPATLLVWILVLVVRVVKPTLPRLHFALIGIATMVLYVGAGVFGGPYLAERRQQRLGGQLDSAILETFDDEPLVDATGPIGVTLRYRVVYPRGLDLDEDHGAFAQLLSTRSRIEFVRTERRVSPRVSGTYDPGTYEITETFLPAFLPWSILAPTAGTNDSGHCFRWSAGPVREEALAEDPAVLDSAIFLASAPITRATKRRYRLRDFYATATQEGGVECAR